MYFLYNRTPDWLKIEWRDQSRMKLEVEVWLTDHSTYSIDVNPNGRIDSQCSFDDETKSIIPSKRLENTGGII